MDNNVIDKTIDAVLEEDKQAATSEGNDFMAGLMMDDEESTTSKEPKKKESKKVEKKGEEQVDNDKKEGDTAEVIDNDKKTDKVEDTPKATPSAMEELNKRADQIRKEHEEELLKLTDKSKENSGDGQKASDNIDKKNFMQALEELDMSDVMIDSDGNKKSFKDIKEDFPEVVQVAAALNHKMTKAEIKSLVESGSLITKKQYNDDVNYLATELANLKFASKLRDFHNDAFKIIDTQEYKEWADKQEPMIKKLYTSSDPRDAAKVLDAYKEYTKASLDAEEKKRKEADIKANADKENKHQDKIHGSSARTSHGPSLSELTGGEKQESDNPANFASALYSDDD